MKSTKKITVALTQLTLIGGFAISAFAQRPDRRQVLVPAEARKLDTAKLRTAPAPGRLIPARKLAMLKTMSDVEPANKSKTNWTPFFRLTPQSPFAQQGYWYFSAPAVYTPHWYDDEGVALFVSPAPTSSQMVLLFSGQPNQAYAIDVTVWVNSTTSYRIGYAVDGTPAAPKERKFDTAKPGFEHLVFDLPASTSGEYEIGISCTQMGSWWAFYSLEAGTLQ